MRGRPTTSADIPTDRPTFQEACPSVRPSAQPESQMKMPFGTAAAGRRPRRDRTLRSERSGKFPEKKKTASALYLGCACHHATNIFFSFVPCSRYFCGNLFSSPEIAMLFLLHLRFCQLRQPGPSDPHGTSCAYVYGNLGHLRFANSCRQTSPATGNGPRR